MNERCERFVRIQAAVGLSACMQHGFQTILIPTHEQTNVYEAYFDWYMIDLIYMERALSIYVGWLLSALLQQHGFHTHIDSSAIIQRNGFV